MCIYCTVFPNTKAGIIGAKLYDPALFFQICKLLFCYEMILDTFLFSLSDRPCRVQYDVFQMQIFICH